MSTQFKVFNEFKGFGNPKGKIWFVGLEEAADFESDLERLIEKYSKGVLSFEPGLIENDAKRLGNRFTKVYDVMSKIIVGLQPELDWKSYRNNLLLTTESNEFQMNLYPLGKKNLAKWNAFYETQFGFKNKQNYLSIVQEKRFPMLFDYWKTYSPSFTICFGIGNIQDFERLFNLTQGERIMESNSIFFEDQRVLVTPFFDNRNMGQSRIDATIKILQNTLNHQ